MQNKQKFVLYAEHTIDHELFFTVGTVLCMMQCRRASNVEYELFVAFQDHIQVTRSLGYKGWPIRDEILGLVDFEEIIRDVDYLF